MESIKRMGEKAVEFTKPDILKRKIQAVEAMRYQDILELPVWETRSGVYINPGEYRLDHEDWRPIRVGQRWTCGVCGTRWFRTQFNLPACFSGQPVVLELDFGGEGLVRVDGEIRSGISRFTRFKGTRTRVVLTESATPGKSYSLEIEAGINYLEFFYMANPERKEIEYQIGSAFAAIVDKQIETYYFDISTALEAIPAISDDFVRQRVQMAVLTSLTDLDFDLGREAFLASLPRAHRVYKERIREIPYQTDADITFVGQAHIDTAWLWPLKETVRKCAKTMSNVLDLMERYPELVFAFSQPQQYEYIKQHYPVLYERMAQRVAEGRIEPVGNTWVEMDTNIPSGESLVRQLLYGKAFFQKEFGTSSPVFWMPDVFGYSWALPQIIKRSGMEFFFTSKLVNNDTNRFPHSLFLWQGIDGTRVLSYLQRLNYNGEYNPGTVAELYRQFDQKALSDGLMMTFGYGDGGGGPSYEMMETGRRLGDFPGLPKTHIASAESFFRQVDPENLPVWNDEMYYEYHRGTFTSQANTKKNNRKAEFLYRRAEMVAALCTSLHGSPYPCDSLLKGYQMLLTNQFHDIIPGSSIQLVYQDCDRDYNEIFAIGREIEARSMACLSDNIRHQSNSILVFNPLAWKREEAVTVLIAGRQSTDLSIRDAEGTLLPCTARVNPDGTEVTFIAPAVSLGWTVFHVEEEERLFDPVIARRDLLENEFLAVSLDTDGSIIGIYDKINRCQVLAKPSNIFQLFEDKPACETAWNIDLEYQNKMWLSEPADSVEVVEQSAVRGVVRIKRRIFRSLITQDIILTRNARRVDFETVVDWQETEKLLKVAFYPDVLTASATYEIQFGSIQRPTHRNTSYDRAKFEVCGHKWADLSEGGYGFSLLNDCKYGYDTQDNQIRLTLLRAPVDPDPTADRGVHQFTYSVYPHSENWRQARTVQEGYNLNQPLMAFWKPEAGGISQAGSYVTLDRSHVVLDTLKCAEDGQGLILRLYEAHGARGPVRMNLALKGQKLYECNLMEENERLCEYADQQAVFHIKPYEIKTFRLV